MELLFVERGDASAADDHLLHINIGNDTRCSATQGIFPKWYRSHSQHMPRAYGLHRNECSISSLFVSGLAPDAHLSVLQSAWPKSTKLLAAAAQAESGTARWVHVFQCAAFLARNRA